MVTYSNCKWCGEKKEIKYEISRTGGGIVLGFCNMQDLMTYVELMLTDYSFDFKQPTD